MYAWQKNDVLSLKLHKCSLYQKGTGSNQPSCKHDRKILVRTKATLIFYDGCCQKESMKYADQKKVFLCSIQSLPMESWYLMPNFEFIASIIELAMDRTNSALLKRYIIQVKVAETQSVLLFWDFRTSINVDNALYIKLPLPTEKKILNLIHCKCMRPETLN